MESLIIVVIAFFLILFIFIHKAGQTRNSEREAQQAQLSTIGANLTVKYEYEAATHYRGTLFALDDTSKKVYVAWQSPSMTEIPYAEIIGCEIVENSQIVGGVGRALVGGVIAGGAGAIVGASTSKEWIQSYKVIIYRDNITEPQYVMELIDVKVKKGSLDYQRAIDFANKVNASIKAIMAQNTMKNQLSNKDTPMLSAAQEIEQLANLRDKGILTEDEFMEKKRQLLKI